MCVGSSWSCSDCTSWAERHGMMLRFFSLHPPRDARLMRAGLSDANFDQFIEMISPLPPLVYKQFVGGILKLCKHPVSHQSLLKQLYWFTYLKRAIWWVLTSAYSCETIATINIANISVVSQHFPHSCHPSLSSFSRLFLSSGIHWQLFYH